MSSGSDLRTVDASFTEARRTGIDVSAFIAVFFRMEEDLRMVPDKSGRYMREEKMIERAKNLKHRNTLKERKD